MNYNLYNERDYEVDGWAQRIEERLSIINYIKQIHNGGSYMAHSAFIEISQVQRAYIDENFGMNSTYLFRLSYILGEIYDKKCDNVKEFITLLISSIYSLEALSPSNGKRPSVKNATRLAINNLKGFESDSIIDVNKIPFSKLSFEPDCYETTSVLLDILKLIYRKLYGFIELKNNKKDFTEDIISNLRKFDSKMIQGVLSPIINELTNVATEVATSELMDIDRTFSSVGGNI